MKAIVCYSLLLISTVCVTRELPAQFSNYFSDSKIHKTGKLWVTITNYGQIGGNQSAGVLWPGTDIQGLPRYINRGGFWFGGIVPSDGTNGPDLNDSGDLDTLVSEGTSAWSVVDFAETFPHYPDSRSAIEVRSSLTSSEFYHPSAVSEEDFIAVYTDTFLNVANFSFSPPKHQRSLGLEIIEKSYQFSLSFAEDIVFFDLVIINVGNNYIRNFYAGIFADNDMGCRGNAGDQSDATGFMAVNSFGDVVNTAWVVETDGGEGCMAGVVGFRILRPTSRAAPLAFNWWMSDSDINSKEDWGPITPNVLTGDPNSGDPIGTPVDDPEKYILMSNGSIDWNQYDTDNNQFDSRIPVPMGPFGFIANDPSRFLLSVGPMGTRDSTITDQNDSMFGQTVKIFAPGDSILFTFAIIGGSGDPNVARGLNSYDPAAFEDLGKNAIIANSFFDTPGVDTDNDGFAGLDLNNDGIIDTGDDVPDFTGLIPPLSPPLKVIPGDRTVTLDWSAADPNNSGYDATDQSLPLNFIDPFYSDNPNTEEDERIDFEGFRVLRSKTGETGTFELLAEYDLPNNSIGNNTGLSFNYVDHVPNGSLFYYSVISFDRGATELGIESLESDLLTNLTKVNVSPQLLEGFAKVWVEPNPYVSGDGFKIFSMTPEGIGVHNRAIDFVNVPDKSTIRIFTLDGDLVHTLKHNDPFYSRVRWDLFSRTGRAISSGLYIFSVETINGDRQVGRFVIIK